MYLKIKGWKGRLGNNILQVINLLMYAKYLKMNVKINKLKNLINRKKIIFFPNKTENIFLYDENYDFTNTKIKINNKEYDFTKKIKINNKEYKEYDFKIKGVLFHESIRKELLNMFNIERKDIINFPQKTLIIYIRSGDLFPQTQKKYILNI